MNDRDQHISVYLVNVEYQIELTYILKTLVERFNENLQFQVKYARIYRQRGVVV